MDASGSTAADLRVDPEERSRAEAWVAVWDRVPFGSGERFHVLREIETARQAGFATGTAKIAMHHGRITRAPGVEVPDEVLCAVSPAFRSADDPLRALREEIAQAESAGEAGPGLGSHRGRVLQITGARRGHAEFTTDRGPRTLPAWFIDIEDALGPAVVLDPGLERHPVAGVPGVLLVRAPARDVADGEGSAHGAATGPGTGRRTPARRQDDSRAAGARPILRACQLAPDGRTLTVHFIGSPAVYTDYPAGYAVEGRNAVSVVPIAVDRPCQTPRRPRTVHLSHLPWHRRPGRAVRWFVTTWVLGRRPVAARMAYAQQRAVTVVLAEPLGMRVVAESGSGQPLSVEPAGDDGTAQ